MLCGDVGLRRVGGDTHDLHAHVPHSANVVDRAHTRQHQTGNLGVDGVVDGNLDQFALVDLAEAVVERRTAESVSVRDFNDRHACIVETDHHVPHGVDAELVRDGMGAVAHAAVGHTDVEIGGVGHRFPFE